MKIKIRRKFKYTFDNRKTHELMPGEYDVPKDISKKAADLALEWGAAVIVPAPKMTKKAPENKATKASETK